MMCINYRSSNPPPYYLHVLSHQNPHPKKKSIIYKENSRPNGLKFTFSPPTLAQAARQVASIRHKAPPPVATSGFRTTNGAGIDAAHLSQRHRGDPVRAAVAVAPVQEEVPELPPSGAGPRRAALLALLSPRVSRDPRAVGLRGDPLQLVGLGGRAREPALRRLPCSGVVLRHEQLQRQAVCPPLLLVLLEAVIGVMRRNTAEISYP